MRATVVLVIAHGHDHSSMGLKRAADGERNLCGMHGEVAAAKVSAAGAVPPGAAHLPCVPHGCIGKVMPRSLSVTMHVEEIVYVSMLLNMTFL
ncbi:hypothetical protein ERJ75_001190000 [Trypanosoma vivax]|nr:hypothetical protein ERJ75_001190000 [Trypanosoma vivax]